MINELVFPNKPKLISSEKNKAIFEISPLYPGYGVTIGNALRRVLLSSLPGAAITTLHIENVLHEFSTIPGVLEDVLDITLNLKQIRIKYDGIEPVEVELYKKGVGEVYAKDIQCPAGVEIINKNQLIATITSKDTELKMKMIIEKGYGYSPSESRVKERVEPGTIFLDAIFSPIVNVGYTVENIVYKEKTDFNLLRITIETDGTITPEEALKKAVEILIDHFQIVGDIR
ncbi:MAG: DNA-directed RNA polymerase subunit alpha [Minisyncoccia bacterium]